ncbi:hypothetical protein OROGR_008882 [Orobanche gracilis]
MSELSVVALPRLIELRSVYNKKLLRIAKEYEEGVVKLEKGFVEFSGEHSGSADAKFEVHSSSVGNGLVHIRSCYNNKYLRVSDDNNWTVAKAEKTEEDQSKRSCTLLRPTTTIATTEDGNSGTTIRLTNVHLENNLCLWQEEAANNDDKPTAAAGEGGVVTSNSDPDTSLCDVFDVIDLQSRVQLPQYVAFKGDNNMFLRGRWLQKLPYLQFSLGSVGDDPKAAGNEITTTSNGNIYIRNMYYDKYWRLMPYWIRCDVTNPVTKNNDTLFEVVLCGDDTIALRSVDNKLFCTRTSMDNKDSVLCCQTPSINTWAMFKVSDFVLSRKIENIDFRIADAMIYNVKIVTLVTSSHINQGSTARESVFTLSYKQSTSSTWNSSISRMTNIKTTFKAVIPLIVDGGIEMGLQNSQVYTWGETKVEEQEISNSYKVVIPPNTKVKLRVMCTIGTCDVPFSYTQQDVLPTGETVTTKMDDGVYTGNNNYFFETQSKEESLVKDPNIPAQGFKTFVVMDGEMD